MKMMMVTLFNDKETKSWEAQVYTIYIYLITSLTVLNQCRLPRPPSEPISVHLSASTSHSDGVVLPTKPLYVHWTQSRCFGDSEHVSPTPWHRCASPWTPWVSSASLGASRSSSRLGLGPSCTVNTGEVDKRLYEGQSWLLSCVKTGVFPCDQVELPQSYHDTVPRKHLVNDWLIAKTAFYNQYREVLQR